MKWFFLLLSSLLPRVGEDDGIEPNDDPQPAAEPDDVTEPDTEEEGAPADEDVVADDEPPAARTRARPHDREIEELRAQTRRLEQEIELERTARRQPAGPSPEQQQWEREQRMLDNPETSAQDRHAIETNRALRQSHAMSQAAHARAEDLADRSEYNLKALDNPVYRKYADRVEAERQRIAANGRGVPPRETVLAVLLGQDMLKGDVKAAKAKPKIARPVIQKPRTDIPAKAGKTDREKLRARLENQII